MDVQNVQNSKAIAGSSESGAAGTWGGEYLLDFEVGAPSKPQRVHLFILFIHYHSYSSYSSYSLSASQRTSY